MALPGERRTKNIKHLRTKKFLKMFLAKAPLDFRAFVWITLTLLIRASCTHFDISGSV